MCVCVCVYVGGIDWGEEGMEGSGRSCGVHCGLRRRNTRRRAIRLYDLPIGLGLGLISYQLFQQ